MPRSADIGADSFQRRQSRSRARCPLAVLLAFGATSPFACGVRGGGAPSDAAAGGTIGAGGVGGTSGSGVGGSSGSGGLGASGVTGTAGTAGSGGDAGVGGVAGNTIGAGGAPSGVTIKIGNVDVPKENVIAFVHFGHSNMAGRGVSPTGTRPFFFESPDAHGWMYHSGKGFEPALEPNTAGDPNQNRLNGMLSGGPGTALVKEAVALAVSKDKYFVSVGFGQSSAYCSQFLPGALYYDKVIAGAKELKGKVTFAAIVVMLGITERHGTAADIAGYPDCINKLVTAVRADLGEPNLPLLLNDYEMGTTGPNNPNSTFAMAIRPKILKVPSMVSNSVIIPTDNPIVEIQADNSTNDWHHFSLDGHKEYVRRVLATMKAKGWFPW